MNHLYIPCDVADVSDGYHTFNELYDHRTALFLALAKALNVGWRSKLHADGTIFYGWFIAGLSLPTGEISYHLPLYMWDTAHYMHTYDRAPGWDGHTPLDVVERLLCYVYLKGD